ncbi:MAG: terminase small subunit [Oscillospiraceae bacterium]
MNEQNEREKELEMLSRQLNDKQRRFVHELEMDGNQTEAAKRAGYSEKTAAQQGSSLLRNPKVLAYKRARDTLAYLALGMDENRVALNITEIFNRCMAGKPHLSWDSEEKAWKPDGIWLFDGKTALRALELMGKNLGMFADNVKISGNVGGVEGYLKSLPTAQDEF